MKRGFKLIEASVILAAVIVLVLILFPFMMFDHNHEKARQATCMSNQRQIVEAAIMWAEEHHGKLPEALGWAATLKLDNRLLNCPSKKKNGGNSYGYNFYIAGKKVDRIKNPQFKVFTADCGRSVTDSIIRTPADYDPRHQRGKSIICSYVDGSVKLTKLSELSATTHQHITP